MNHNNLFLIFIIKNYLFSNLNKNIKIYSGLKKNIDTNFKIKFKFIENYFISKTG
jgi:hypothetical protein